MKFTDLSIDNFGALSRFALGEIAPGLNVVHGPNGSGKTTLLQFIRGIFGGFKEARRLQLIPPVGAGGAGGTIGIEWGSRRLAVIRHSRPDEYETLAINVRQGLSDEGHSLRKHLESFDDERLSVLFTAGSFDANSVEALISLARNDGLDLTTVPGNESLLASRLTHLHSQRSTLLSDLGDPGRMSQLQLLSEAIAAEGLSIHRRSEERREQLARDRAELHFQIAATDQTTERLHLEWQALATDLAECEARLWSSAADSVTDVVYVQETQAPLHNPRLPAVEDLDLRIEHLRTVLKDLAASRQHISLHTAESAGVDVPSREVFVARQREALRVMQQQLQVLGGTVQWLEAARFSGSCVCSSVEERLSSVVDELRRQVELSCQELSRQQAAWRLEQHRADRLAVDECEAGLQRQLEWLRLRREDLLNEAAHPVMSRLAHTIAAERQYCGCPDHTATSRATTPRTVTRRTIQERPGNPAPVHSDEAVRQVRLATSAKSAHARWQASIARSSELEQERLANLRTEHSIDVEALLADCERRLGLTRSELDHLQHRQAALNAVELEIRAAESQIVQDRASRVVAEASEHLDLLTLGRYRALRTSDDGHNLQIIAENGSPYVAAALSRGTLFQVALALRVALVDEYARRGLEFPLVLDDVLVDSDEHRLEAAAHLLSSTADRGRQILFLTCQDHLVNLLEDRGAAIHNLPGAERVQRAKSFFVPAAPPLQMPATPEPEPVVETVSPPVPATVPAAEPIPDSLAPLLESPLDIDSPAALIPSLYGLTAVRLADEGFRTIGQIIEIDVDAEASLLSRLNLSRQNVLTWQSEAHLLCCVPGLTRDDAQLLVAVGIHTPQELAGQSVETLHQRIQRFRGSTPHAWHAWMRDRNTWPREATIADWIASARSPRPLRPERGSFLLRPHILPAAEIAQATDDDFDNNDPDDNGPQPSPENEGPIRHRRHKPHSGRARSGFSQRTRSGGTSAARSDGALRYFLTIDSPIVDAPSIGPKTAKMLNRAGVQTVAQLLARSAAELSSSLADRAITPDVVTTWQQQSRLMCEIPELRGHDAQLLVACGFPTTQAVSRASALGILAKTQPFARTKAGQRLLRSAAPPQHEEVAAWVAHAGHVSLRRAA